MITRIGIYAPYQNCETSWAALALAKDLQDLGLTIQWLASKPRVERMCKLFDSKVLPFHNHFGQWFQKCHKRIFFDIPPALSKLELGYKKPALPESIMVFMPHNLQMELSPALPNFETVVCPGEEAHRAIKQSKLSRTQYLLPWCPISSLRASALVDKYLPTEYCQLAVQLEPNTSRAYDAVLLNVFSFLLEAMPELKITLFTHCAWTGAGHYALAGLTKQYENRIKILRNVDHLVAADIIANQDWFFNAGVKDCTGYWTLEALQLGVPVIAFDLSPNSEILRNDHNGRLLPCDLMENWLNVPSAVIKPKAMFDVLLATLKDRAYNLEIRQRSLIELGIRRNHFRESWQLLLGLSTECPHGYFR
jgi:hypothetical protein